MKSIDNGTPIWMKLFQWYLYAVLAVVVIIVSFMTMLIIGRSPIFFLIIGYGIYKTHGQIRKMMKKFFTIAADKFHRHIHL